MVMRCKTHFQIALFVKIAKLFLLNSPIPNCNIYIELLNSTGEIIDKKINWAQNGLHFCSWTVLHAWPNGLPWSRIWPSPAWSGLSKNFFETKVFCTMNITDHCRVWKETFIEYISDLLINVMRWDHFNNNKKRTQDEVYGVYVRL